MKKQLLLIGLYGLLFAFTSTMFADCCFAQQRRTQQRRPQQRQNTSSQQNTRSAPRATPPATQPQIQPQIQPEMPQSVEELKPQSFSMQEMNLDFQNIPREMYTDKTWHVVLFAVNEYDVEKQSFLPLAGCYNDMLAIQDEWLLAMGVPVENIQLLHDNAPDSHLKPTAKNLLNAIDKCLSEAKKDDYVLIAFACHGMAFDGKSYLCPSDYVNANFSGIDTEEKQKRYAKEHNLVEVAEVIGKLSDKKVQATNKLLIIDACREKVWERDSDRHDFMKEFKSLSDKIDFSKDETMNGLCVLTSCTLGQCARENTNESRGVFSKCFIEGIRYGLADFAGKVDGEITLGEAYNYAVEKTALYSMQTPIQGMQLSAKEKYPPQTPELFYNSNLHTFIIAKNKLLQQNYASKSDSEFVYDTSLFVVQNAQQKIAASYSRNSRNMRHPQVQQQQTLYSSAIQGLDYVAMEQPNNQDVYAALSNCYLNRQLCLVGDKQYQRIGDSNSKREDIAKALEYSKIAGKPLVLYAEDFVKALGNAVELDPNLVKKYEEKFKQISNDEQKILELKNEMYAEIENATYHAKINLYDERQNIIGTVDYGQKVCITDIKGDYLWVEMADYNTENLGLGWIHMDYVDWKPANAEWYRPQTELRPEGRYYTSGQIYNNVSQLQQDLQAAQTVIGIANSFGANIPGGVSMGIGIAQQVLQLRQMSPQQRRETILREAGSRIPYIGGFF